MIEDDTPEPSEDDRLRDEAKRVEDPEPLPDATDLPDDVRDGHIEDEADA